jgi:hypothetical protein
LFQENTVLLDLFFSNTATVFISASRTVALSIPFVM